MCENNIIFHYAPCDVRLGSEGHCVAVRLSNFLLLKPLTGIELKLQHNFNHSLDYIFISFRIIWAHCCIFKNGFLFMYTLESVSSVANFINAVMNVYIKTEIPIFYML